MKRRIPSILTALALCLALFPTGAMAAGDTAPQAAWQAEEDGAWETGTLSEAVEQVYDGGIVQLLENVALTQGLTVSDSVTITSGQGGPFIITDAEPGHGSLLTLDAQNETLTLEQIILDGGSAGGTESSAALVTVTEGTLILGSGAVLHNNNNTSDDSLGGGLSVQGGSVTLESDASIGACCAASGGGAWVSPQGNILISGNVQISGNKNQDGEPDNLVLDSAFDEENFTYVLPTLSLTGPLGGEAEVGVTFGPNFGNPTLAQGADYTLTDADMMEFVLDKEDYVLVRDKENNQILCQDTIQLSGDTVTEPILYRGSQGTAVLTPATGEEPAVFTLYDAVLPASVEISGELLVQVNGASEITYDFDCSDSHLVTITGDTLYTEYLVNAAEDQPGLLHIYDGEVVANRISWLTAEGIQLTNSLLTVQGVEGDSVNLLVNRIQLDDQSELQSSIPLSSYKLEEGTYDFSALTQLLPEGCTIGWDQEDITTMITILDSEGHTLPNFNLGNRPVHPTAVTLDRTTVQMQVGDTATLTATVSPDNADDPSLTWDSSAPKVVTVDDSGTLTAVAVGNATITATTVDGGKSATCAVTVTEVPQPSEPTTDPEEGEKDPSETQPPTTPDDETPSTPQDLPTTTPEELPEEPPEPVVPSALAYIDLDTEAWYMEAVNFVVSQKLMVGYGNQKFRPNEALTRAEMVQILYNWAGRPQLSADVTSSFSDVTPGSWYYEAICWAAQAGIVEGYGNHTFGPNDKITREQLIKILWKNADSPQPGIASLNFSDGSSVSSWAKDSVLWAIETGLLQGCGDGTLRPTANATRAQAAQILMRFYEN